MAIRRRGGKAAEGDNNIFWTTMSDLMLGLAIVFMTLFVLAMTGFTQQSVKQKVKQIEVNKELTEKLRQEHIDAQVDEMTGDIKISDLELFELGSYRLSAKGKAYLDKFASNCKSPTPFSFLIKLVIFNSLCLAFSGLNKSFGLFSFTGKGGNICSL